MSVYKRLKFQMKLQYEAWNRSIEVITLIKYSIAKTLKVMLCHYAMQLKSIVLDPTFNSQHRLYSTAETKPKAVDASSIEE